MSIISLNGSVEGLKRLSRKSTHLFSDPMVTLKDICISFNSSAKDKLELDNFKRCYLSVSTNESYEEATKVYLEPNNDPETYENLNMYFSKQNLAANITGIKTIYDQIIRLKALSNGTKFERKIILKFCDKYKLWYIPLAPAMEKEVFNIESVKGVKSVYQLMTNERIERIGHTNDLARRIQEHRDAEIPFNRILYSPMNTVDDDSRKDWERYFLDQYKKIHGVLPPWNFVNGRKIS